MCHSWVAYCRTPSRRNPQLFYGRAQKSWANIRENKGPSLNEIQVKVPHQRNPCPMKIEDRSQEGTERQERCACGDAWRLAKKKISTLKEKDKATFFSPTDERSLPSTIKLEEREFVVDSGASMPVVSRKDLNPAVLDTVKVSKKTDDGCYSQRRNANKRRCDSVCQRIGFLRDRKASRRYTGRSFIRKTLRRSREILALDQWSETTTHQQWQKDRMQHCALRTIRCPCFIDKLFKLIFTYISFIFIAGSRNSNTASRIDKK